MHPCNLTITRITLNQKKIKCDLFINSFSKFSTYVRFQTSPAIQEVNKELISYDFQESDCT